MYSKYIFYNGQRGGVSSGISQSSLTFQIGRWTTLKQRVIHMGVEDVAPLFHLWHKHGLMDHGMGLGHCGHGQLKSWVGIKGMGVGCRVGN